jgi:osmotically-inducible protein OsmY
MRPSSAAIYVNRRIRWLATGGIEPDDGFAAVECVPSRLCGELREGVSMTTNIRAAVYEELHNDLLLDPVDIEVELLGSQVVLNGTVPSQAQRTEAGEAASRVPGVAGVRNLLAVALPSADYGDDAALTRMVNAALAANSAVPDGVVADAREGNVWLRGIVTESAQRVAAEDAAANCGGVLTISNEIVVRGS